MGWLGNGMFPQPYAVACSVEIFPKRQVNDVENIELLCRAVNQQMKSRSDKSNSTFPACSPFLPNLTTYLPPFLHFLHYLAVCLLRLGLFWQVIMKMFWVIETKARSSQSNNGTAAVATTTMRMTTTTVAFLSSAQLGRRSWAWHGRR